MSDTVLIVGAGIAGVSAGLMLARQGLQVHIVEKNAYPGGHVADFCCKATDICNKCMVCNAFDHFNDIGAADNVHFHFNSSVIACKSESSPFEVKIRCKGPAIDEKVCIRCGLCSTACKTSAISLSHLFMEPRYYYIDAEKCIRSKGDACTACSDICPVSCITLDEAKKDNDIKATAIIVSTGYDPFDARNKPQFGYGRFPHVMTAKELESQFAREGGLPPGSDGMIPRKVAFIQCVGSRDPHIGRGYCSRACCGYAVRLSRLIRHTHPETAVTMFYIDIQTFGRDFHDYMKRCMMDEKLRFIKGVPARLFESDKGIVAEFEDMTSGKNCEELFDLVVLSIGMGPREDSEETAGLFGLGRDEDGFFSTGESTPHKGIFLAGACRGPRDISSTIAEGESTAARVISYLRR